MAAVVPEEVPGERVRGWLAARGWQPFAFQEEVWQAVDEGQRRSRRFERLIPSHPNLIIKGNLS